MSQNAIKCPWNKYILLPDDLIVYAGTDCNCPAACPNRKSNRQDCLFEIFKTKKDSTDLPSKDITTYSYTPEEVVRQFPDYKGLVSPDPSFTADKMVDSTPVQSQYQDSSMASQSNKFGSYVLPVFGKNESTHSDANSTIAQSSTRKSLEPLKKYNFFELRGSYYTLDGQNGTMNLKDIACAENMYYLILRTFDIESVFDCNGVRDEFLWVLNNTLTGEKRERVTQVLKKDDFEKPMKFFLLFYYAIFYEKSLPLYWAQGYSPKLKPIYKDVSDFHDKISRGCDANFYNNNTKLTLLWLKKITFSDLEDNKKIMDAFSKIQNDITFDKNSNAIVFWSYASNKFVSLGNKDTFVKGLTVSDKSTKELEYTVEFLKRFDIICSLGQYRIVCGASSDCNNSIEISKDECNDDIMQMLFSCDRSMDKLQYYLYIVKRYYDLFKPCSVKIGSLTFEDSRYTEQIEELVMTMCSYIFGDAATDEQKRLAYNNAMLAKILYNHKIIFELARAKRSEEYMDTVLSLVTSNINVSRYLEICHRYGMDDKVKLYAYDYSVVPPKEKLFSLRDRLNGMIRSTGTTHGLRELLSLPIFKAYKEVLGVGDNDKRIAENLYNNYKIQENEVDKILNSL